MRGLHSGNSRIYLTSSWIALGLTALLSGTASAQTSDQGAIQYASSDTTAPQGQQASAGQIGSADVKPGDSTSDTSEILVVGTRASLRSAIQRKRNADTVVDSIVADDIASFPDKNVGDSLARITGVQLDRDFGEGVRVSIRGVEPDLNRVEINGVSQVSADGTRAGDFRELATELVKSIDVYKGYSADLTEGGIGGTVRIETRKPLELRDPLASIVFSEQHLDTTQDWKPRATLIAGTPHFLIDGLGVLLNVTYDDVSTRQDYISNTNWKRLADFDHSTDKTVADPLYSNFDTYESCANVGGENASNATARRLACETQFFDWAPTVPRYRQWVRHDQRISGDFTVQYEFAHNFRAYAEAQINNRNQNLQDTNYSLDMGRYQRFATEAPLPVGLDGATSQPRVASGTATVDDNHVVTSFQTALNTVNIGSEAAPNYNGASNILGVQRRDFSYDQKSRYFLGGFDWDFDQVKISGLVSHASAHTEGETNLISYGTGVSGVIVDRRNDQGIPAFIFPSSVDPSDPSIYSDFTRRDADGNLITPVGPTLQYRPTDANNSEDQYKIDVDWEIDAPILKSIEYGGQFRWQSYLNYNGGGSRLLESNNGADPVYQTSANVSFTTRIVDKVTQRQDGNTFFMTPDEYAALVAANHGVTGGAPLFTGLKNAPSDIPGRLAIPAFDRDVLSQYYDLSNFDNDLVRYADGLPQIPSARIKEKIAAAYIKANIDTDIFGMHLTGNAGVRYVHTIDAGTGTNISRVTRFTSTGGTETVTLAAQSLTLHNSYTDWLPAFNAALEITPDLIFRANWAKNLARPKPTDLVPNINCLDDLTVTGLDDTCSAGNPDLLPYRADQWEVNLAWYPNRDTLVSLGYYKKYESSFVVPNVTRDNVDLFGDGITYTVRQPINGFGALLDGIEVSGQTVFSFLPQPFDGFGVTGNFTYARAIRTNLTNGATNEPLTEYPGLSKYTWNASLFYDKGWLNVRLNYNYRSKWLTNAYDSNNGGNPVYRKGEGFLDAKATFRFPDLHTSLFVEMQNINKEYSETYIDAARPIDLYYPGQRYFAGVQFKF